jgi:hypothetical protein
MSRRVRSVMTFKFSPPNQCEKRDLFETLCNTLMINY